MAEHREGYGIVLQRVMRDPSLSVESKAIYGYLSSFAGASGSCYPSVKLMCAELNMSETRFSKHMKPLKEAGIVTVTKQREGTRFAQNVYEIVRPSVSPSREIIGAEIRAPITPGRNIPGTENDRIKNTSSKITRVDKKNSISDGGQDLVTRVCGLLNEGKYKASSKGRLKVETGVWIIRDLVRAGISQAAILAAAQEAAANGADLDWFSFEAFCKKR